MVRHKATTGRSTERSKKRDRLDQHLQVRAKKDDTMAVYLKWMTLLRPVTADADPRFCGEATIEQRQAAIFTAAEASDAAYDPYDRVFFASGTSTTRQAEDKQREGPGPKDKIRWFGAGIAYRKPQADEDGNFDDFWMSEMIPLGPSAEDRSTDAGVAAIAQCLAIAAREMESEAAEQDKTLKNQRRVTVFTHCRSTVLKIEKFRHLGPSELEFLKLEDYDKLLTASQQLSDHLGVVPELRWIPRSSGVIGSWHAEAAALDAAMEFDEEPEDTVRDAERRRKQDCSILCVILPIAILSVTVFSHWTPSWVKSMLNQAIGGVQRFIRSKIQP